VLIRQLEYFVAVAREQHFGRAAASCYASQPALSTAIGKLERELNVTLINRGQHFRGLTPAGMRLVGRAARILEDHSQMKAIAAEFNSGLSDTLRLGVGPTVSPTTTAKLVARFCTVNPAAVVRVCAAPAPDGLMRQLIDDELDAALGHFESPAPTGCTVVPLYFEQYVLVADASLVPRMPSMTWLQAVALPLALPGRGAAARQLIDATFGKVGVVAEPRIEMDSLAGLYAHVMTGEYASVVPRTWLQAMPANPATRVVDLVEPITTEEISVAVNPQHGSATGRAFFDLLMDPVSMLQPARCRLG
jgi:DNA-binding transcriptional LysR family regulator